jgi:NADH-quinone oxidoreductase subunit N
MLVIATTSIVVLMIEAFLERSEGLNSWVTLAGLVTAGVLALTTLEPVASAFSGMVTTGGYAHYFAAVFCLAGLLSVMLSPSYIERTEIAHGEYYVLILLSVLGMMFMAAAADLIIFFLGLELMSIPFYVLAGFIRRRETSNEAALKYFLLGAFATGFLLYGIALVYGATGTTMIAAIASAPASGGTSMMLLAGLGLLLIGLAFKVAAVPFHMWVPDVYEGAPTTVTAFMSTAGKAAAFAALLLIFSPALISGIPALRDVLAVVAALSMVVGNVFALAQSSVKRMLAYSSIAHAGYILTGVIAGNEAGGTGVLFYLVAYTVMNAGAFGVLSMVESREGTRLSFEDYEGFSDRWPLLSALMALFMFSLTGIPPFAGFFGKYYVFAAAVEAGYTWLAILGVIMSVVSAYYYLRLVVLMYFRKREVEAVPAVSALGMAALVVAALLLVQFGVFPSTLLNLTTTFF